MKNNWYYLLVWMLNERKIKMIKLETARDLFHDQEDVPTMVKFAYNWLDINLVEQPSKILEFVLWKCKNRYSKVGDRILILVNIANELKLPYFVFGGILKVTDEIEGEACVASKGYILDSSKPLIGRLIFKVNRPRGAQITKVDFDGNASNLKIHSILSEDEAMFTYEDLKSELYR